MELKVFQGMEANPEADMDSKWPGACDASELKRQREYHGYEAGRFFLLGTSKSAVGQGTEAGKLRSLLDRQQETGKHLWRGIRGEVTKS